MDFRVECESCKEFKDVTSIRITKEGRVIIELKCGHVTGFIFAGIIYPVQKPRKT